MSWGISVAGEPKNVAKKVSETSYLPQGIKDFITKISERVPDDKILYVDSMGHHELRLPPEKELDKALTEANGKPTAKDGTPFISAYDMGNENPVADVIQGSGTLTWKVLQKA